MIPYIIAFGLLANQSGLLRPTGDQGNGLWAEVCGSGPAIWIDLGGGDNEPPFPVHTKACHAICCSKKQAADADKVKRKAA